MSTAGPTGNPGTASQEGGNVSLISACIVGHWCWASFNLQMIQGRSIWLRLNVNFIYQYFFFLLISGLVYWLRLSPMYKFFFEFVWMMNINLKHVGLQSYLYTQTDIWYDVLHLSIFHHLFIEVLGRLIHVLHVANLIDKQFWNKSIKKKNVSLFLYLSIWN